MNLLRQFAKILPTLGLSFALALAVWISAVTSADPNEQNAMPDAVPVQIIGQDPGLILADNTPHLVSVVINAPRSRWDSLRADKSLVTAEADLAGLKAGSHVVPIHVNVGIRPAEIVSYSPQTITVVLENLASKPFPIHLVRNGEPAIGFQAEDPTLGVTNATVTGPEPLIAGITEVRAVLNLGDAHQNINATIPIQAYNSDDATVDGVTINPSRVTVIQPITQRGGFRSDLVVKPVYQGKIASGYRLTNISVFPPAVTVFSTDPNRVNQLPGYIETIPINLDGAKDDLEVPTGLNLPQGVSLVGDQKVTVQVGIAAIESSVTLSNQQIQFIGLSPLVGATVSPQAVDAIISGPLPILDTLAPGDIQVVVDLSKLTSPGTYQVAPTVQMRNDQLTAALKVETILPGTVEVTIGPPPTPTVTPRPTSKP